MNYTIAGPSSVSRLIDLRIAYLTEDYGSLSSRQEQAIRSQLPDYFNCHLNRDLTVYVAEENGEPVATVFLLTVEMPANPSVITGKYGTILNVYTKPDYRRKGISRRLLTMAIHDAEKNGLSFLELDSTQAGLPLYDSLGFLPKTSRYTPLTYPL